MRLDARDRDRREVAAAAPDGPRWFQLYVLADRGVTRALVDEAVDCGYQALVLTVDAPRAGPPRARPAHRLRRPARHRHARRHRRRRPQRRHARPPDFFSLVDDVADVEGPRALVDAVDLPVLVKGIHPPPTRGWRSSTAPPVSSSPTTAAASSTASRPGSTCWSPSSRRSPATSRSSSTAACAAAPTSSVALALGARAVLVGRPALWGLAVGGEAGARWVLDMLRAELELGLMLLGAPTPARSRAPT